MNIQHIIDEVKANPRFSEAGMILVHNGVVRATTRDGRAVSGLRVSVDRKRLTEVLEIYRRRKGILEVRVEINADQDLTIGDDVMALVVAGDIRENVITTLKEALDEIKTTVTAKTEFMA
ncbi:MAG: molybdenum cofactor biosynthesis protein MoaE [Desulfobacterales bacterium]